MFYIASETYGKLYNNLSHGNHVRNYCLALSAELRQPHRIFLSRGVTEALASTRIGILNRTDVTNTYPLLLQYKSIALVSEDFCCDHHCVTSCMTRSMSHKSVLGLISYLCIKMMKLHTS